MKYIKGRIGAEQAFYIFIGGVILTILVGMLIFKFSGGVLLNVGSTVLDNIKDIFSWG